jgi:hypothetical protein
MARQSVEILMVMLQSKELELSTYKVANQTLNERIQWLEHLVSDLQEHEEEIPKDIKHTEIGFH